MIQDMKVAALVPIKDHSERVQGKNFRNFCGKPLYHHVVHTLNNTYAVDDILIDTDSPQVLNEAGNLSSKVRVIERPEDIRGDFVSMNRVIEHDLKNSGADIFLQTHATNPMISSETITRALRKFVENMNEFDSLFSVTHHQARFYDKNGKPVNHNPGELIRTQDLPPLYEENSCLYLFTKESFAQKAQRIGEKPMMLATPPVESTDIDDEFKFRLAELLALHHQNYED